MSYAKTTRPFSKRASLSVQGQIPIIFLVLALLLSCGPSAIRWLVIAGLVWVAVYGMRRAWTLTHVVEERFKASGPTVADLYPAAAIHWIGFVFRVIAPSFNPSPYLVFVGTGKAMTSAPDGGEFGSQAPATSGFFSGQVASENIPNSPAVAFALPVTTANVFKNSPSVNANADEILNQFVHGCLLLLSFIYHICRGRA